MDHDAQADFKAAFMGRFSGILRWPQFETLWQAVRSAPEGWYVYAPEETEPPVAPLNATDMENFLTETDVYLRDLCPEGSCGAVYTDSLTEPSFIKVYNPRLMGGCGMGKAPLPQWTISRIAPVSLLEEEEPKPQGLMGKLFTTEA